MEEEKVNADEIIAKLKIIPKTAKFCLIFGIIFLIMGVVGIVMSLSEEPMGFVFIFCGFGFALLFFGIVFAKVLKSKNRLKNINEFELKNELNGGCVSFDKIKTYFTQNYMISNYYYAFVIKYTDIVWIYKLDKKTQNGTTIASDLMICLANGKKESTIYLEELCDEIEKRNNNVFEGFTSENKKAYNEAVKNYKESGTINKAIQSENMVSPDELQIGVTKTIEQESEPVIVLPMFGEEENTQPKDMFAIDPLYSIPGMNSGNGDTDSSTKSFLLTNEDENNQIQDSNILNQNISNTFVTNQEITSNNQVTEGTIITGDIQQQVVFNQQVNQEVTNNVEINNSEQPSESMFIPTTKPMNQQETQQPIENAIKNESYDVNQIRNPFIN